MTLVESTILGRFFYHTKRQRPGRSECGEDDFRVETQTTSDPQPSVCARRDIFDSPRVFLNKLPPSTWSVDCTRFALHTSAFGQGRTCGCSRGTMKTTGVYSHRWMPIVLTLALALVGPLARSPQAQSAAQGLWTTLPDPMPINPVHLALMNNGNVLVVSGS